VHSGSRNLGKQMAEHYDAVARAANRARGSEVPPAWGLAHLGTDTEAGREYLAVMDFCLRFARENRRLMAEAVAEALAGAFPDAHPDVAIDVHHNYAAIETHFGRELVVHRKGAVRAVGDVVIPGSMGTRSYIGRGLANPLAFESCSHGAGRAMGRKQARRALPAEDVLRDMEARDIRLVTADRDTVAEEAAAAYKDIDVVMRAQADLVEPVAALSPLGVVKG
jgi:tRNA-splicing ligase RtcB